MPAPALFGTASLPGMQIGCPGMCRDLALQVHDIITKMRKHLEAPSLRNALIVGGYDPHGAKAQLQGVHIITGTPGRPEQAVSSGSPVQLPIDCLKNIGAALYPHPKRVWALCSVCTLCPCRY